MSARVRADPRSFARTSLLACLCLAARSAAAPATPTGTPPSRLHVWTLEHGRVQSDAEAPAGALPVGSLQKPFVVKAWAAAHVGIQPPVVVCTRTSGCWRPGGHGRCDLVRATAQSCNTYFRTLAETLPGATLALALRAEGFEVDGPLSPAAAIGLSNGDAGARIAPGALLLAYARLTSTPWERGEALRPTLLLGLREAARVGTARGLGRRGFWAKTGTVPALDGQPLRTSGWALALDDSGFGLLGLLPRGTGRETAQALAAPLGAARPWSAVLTTSARPASGDDERTPSVRRPVSASLASQPAEAPALVRVRLFDLLAPRALWAINAGAVPATWSGAEGNGGWIGPGARRDLHVGQQLGNALWELRLPAFGLVRRLTASLSVKPGAAGALVPIAELSVAEYVRGVLAGEAPEAGPTQRAELAATVLRFLADGARHADADVCDATHCARFLGRGPRVQWRDARHVRVLPDATLPPAFDGATWTCILERARAPGPRRFSAHCGGQPLSERYVWGYGDSQAPPCPRHAAGSVRVWRRTWPTAVLTRLVGFPVTGAAIDDSDGTWSLVLTGPRAEARWRYDEAHRHLADELGWDAMPSPAARVHRVATGFEAEGVGAGHRVGLCLGLAGVPGTAATGDALATP